MLGVRHQETDSVYCFDCFCAVLVIKKMVLAKNWDWHCRSKFIQNTKQFGPRNENRVKGSFVNAQGSCVSPRRRLSSFRSGYVC